MDPNLEYAVNTKDKFQFYFLALVFTILGLSIQTSTFSSRIQSMIEIGGWLFLFASGVAGLSRMEWLPVLYEYKAELTRREAFIRDSRAGRPTVDESGEIMTESASKEFTSGVENSALGIVSTMDKLTCRAKAKHFLHKWASYWA